MAPVMRTATRRCTTLLLVALAPLGLTACGGGGISVGNLFGSSAAKPAATAPAPADPLARPVQVAWTSARARRCGFNFNSEKLRRDFFASEAAHLTDPTWLPKAEHAYDFTYGKVWDAARANPDYCSARTIKQIRSDLARHIAGDYTPRPKPKSKEDGSWWSAPGPAKSKMPSRDEIFSSQSSGP